jgi:molecular chaperone GrpE
VVAEAATSDVPPDEPATGDVGPDEGVAEPEEADASSIEHDLDELLSKAKERDEYLSLAQRTQADFENYRKRVARDVGAAEQRGVGKLAKELLPALDSLEIALSHLPEDSVKGVELVQQELLGALGRVGIEVFSPEGEPFDPNEHEAMAKRAVEGVDAGLVAEVYQRGYRVNGSILRPARVVVAE